MSIKCINVYKKVFMGYVTNLKKNYYTKWVKYTVTLIQRVWIYTTVIRDAWNLLVQPSTSLVGAKS